MTSTGKDYVDHIPGYFHIVNAALDTVLPETHPLSGVRPADRIRVAQLVEQVLPEVAEWARDYPIMGGTDGDHSRVVWICLCCSATFPAGPGSLITDYAALVLSINPYDDVMDGVLHGYSLEQLTALTERCIAIGEQRPTEPDHDLTEPERQILAAYRDSFARIAGYPAFAWSGPYLARHWRAAFESDAAGEPLAARRRPVAGPARVPHERHPVVVPTAVSVGADRDERSASAARRSAGALGHRGPPCEPGDPDVPTTCVCRRRGNARKAAPTQLDLDHRYRTDGSAGDPARYGRRSTRFWSISTPRSMPSSHADRVPLGEGSPTPGPFRLWLGTSPETPTKLTARQLRGLVTTHPSPPDR